MEKGSTYRVKATWKDFADALTDPTTPKLHLKDSRNGANQVTDIAMTNQGSSSGISTASLSISTSIQTGDYYLEVEAVIASVTRVKRKAVTIVETGRV